MTLFKNIKAQWIKDLQVGQGVDGLFRVTEVTRRTKKNGEPYLTITLMDKTGKISAKIWSDVEQIQALVIPGEIFSVSGSVSSYQGAREIRVQQISRVAAEDPRLNPADFQEEAGFDLDKTFARLQAVMTEEIATPCLKELTELFFNQYRQLFLKHYGAQKIHHAYPGGLLQHTLGIIELSLPVAAQYHLDKEVLLTGALFHDAGKLFEFATEPALKTTLAGGLLGHIVISRQIFMDLSRQITDFPEELSLHIQHLIVSHHGEKEFGSPEVPKTREALALHILDLLDSKMKIFERAADQSDKKNDFSEYIHVLGRRIFVPETGGEDAGS